MQKPSPFTAFIAGYSDINLESQDIESKLRELRIEGYTLIDIPTKKWKGYAFIEFKDSPSLNKFISLKRIFVKEREIQIKRHKSGFELKKEKKLTEKRRIFVQNIPIEWTDDKLFEVFSHEGEVEECYVVKKHERGSKKINKKVGYVLFRKVDDSLRMIAMEKLIFEGNSLIIKKSRARSHHDKQTFSNPSDYQGSTSHYKQKSKKISKRR